MAFTIYKQHLGAFRFYLAMVTLLVVAVVAGYHYGKFVSEETQRQVKVQAQSVENLKQDNQRLTRQLNILNVELEVNRLAAQQAQRDIEAGLAREAGLREQLNFYQKVMAPELKQDGFVIDAMEIEQTLSEGYYRFDLVLMQQAKIKNTVKGTVTITFVGSQSGRPQHYELQQLNATEQPLEFGFKYFQVINGEFQLPPGFEPESVRVEAEVFQFRRKRGDLERVFPWQAKSPGRENGDVE
ncbi:hypothetical protein LJ739_14485 [Aestuariibacter halophilus]|uniref:Uncharacterized protein n=1 Tax=Fluctibacter halophilus TaxID=226011 RepID=A0ABS8GA88_9ALTE|nr:DUF6776 family protein [Aestuariibacter halophilus]MCC2617457.1 hypothetical protein [Aestuariibacter halophilus]